MTAAVDGRTCSLDEALEAAVRLLSKARFPLVFGLVDSTVEAQREAVRVARVLRGALDPASSLAHAGSLAAYQRDGALTATLGEMRRRADLVVFWACDPDREHPGFVARFAPARAGRLRLAVDVGDDRGPGDADERLGLPRSAEIAALVVLRAFLRGRRLDPAVSGPLGLPTEALRALARRLLACGYGVLVTEAEPPEGRRDPARALVLTRLARDARPKARLRVLGLRPAGNSAGAESVMTWLTGFPAAVSFASGRAAFGPGEWSAASLLRRGETDAALVVGADPARHLPDAAHRALLAIPTVRLAPPGAGPASPAVLIATAPLGESAGHRFRMDGLLPAPRTAPVSDLPEEAAVLAQLAGRLEARGAP